MDTTVSIKDTEEVRAANSTSRKNSPPNTRPRVPASANTLGRVTNISPLPWFRAASSPPEKANTAGMIINPATKAMPVSNSSICFTDFSKSSSFFI